jgi:hypothetical protein
VRTIQIWETTKKLNRSKLEKIHIVTLRSESVVHRPTSATFRSKTPCFGMQRVPASCVLVAVPWRRRRQSCTRPDASPTRFQRTLVRFASALSSLYRWRVAYDSFLSATVLISSGSLFRPRSECSHQCSSFLLCFRINLRRRRFFPKGWYP